MYHLLLARGRLEGEAADLTRGTVIFDSFDIVCKIQ
jgi:hypothetical protein